MGRFLDRTGIRYGRLLVIEHKGKNHNGKHLWLCKCDCGNEKIVVSCNLSSGKSKSCGCLKIEYLKNNGFQYQGIKDRNIAVLKLQYSSLKKKT